MSTLRRAAGEIVLDMRGLLALVKRTGDAIEVRFFDGHALTAAQMLEPSRIDEVFDIPAGIAHVLK